MSYYRDTEVTLYQGDVFSVLPTLERGSVDCVVTSPPYWQLRSYLPKGHALKQYELGSEPTPEAFVANLVRVMGLVREVMADHAVAWINIGDTYAASGKSGGGEQGKQWERAGADTVGPRGGKWFQAPNIDAGNLALIPQRLAIALQSDGWVVRSVVVWCLSPSTRVYAKTATTEGPATLHDLIRLDPSTVKLWNGQKWTQVRGWSKTRCDNSMRVVLRSGEAISATPNHQWPLADGRVVRADELKVGDVLATCALPEPEPRIGDGIDPDLAWLAGLYLAEGCIWDDAIRISGNAKETERHEKVCRLALKFGGTSTLRADEGDSVTQTLHGDILRGAINHFVAGKGAKGKHLHPRCWALPNKLLMAFLEGYLAGDGHRDPKNDRWRLAFCRNNAWAADLRTLAARLGLTLTLNPGYARMGRTRTFESYRGELRFSRNGHHSERERAEIVAIHGGWPGDFIDVGVEDEPNLFALASGVLTHNSKPAPMPASVSGWAWRRCRVKQSSRPHRDHPGETGKHAHTPASKNGIASLPGAQWSDCPGCAKCEKAGGYVLRRGSWRPTSSWEPVLMLAKGERYYADGEAVKQPVAKTWNPATNGPVGRNNLLPDENGQSHTGYGNPSGANLRDVWRIASAPLKAKHFAAFPPELARRCIKAGTSAKGYCRTCGLPWVRVVDQERYEPTVVPVGVRNVDASRGDKTRKLSGQDYNEQAKTRTLGWRPSCSCPDSTPRPALVLDPFSGAGTTVKVARDEGRHGVGIELNPEYLDLSVKRLRGKLVDPEPEPDPDQPLFQFEE